MKTISKALEWSAFCSALFIISAVLSIFGYFIVSLAALGIGVIAFKRRLTIKKGIDQIDFDTIQFLDALLNVYSKSKNLYASLETTSNGSYAFSDTLRTSLIEYRDGVQVKTAFDDIGNYGSVCLNEAFIAICHGLTTGDDIGPALASIRESAREKDAYRLKTLGALENVFIINRLGGVVFFPLFAGISLDIIKFTSSYGGNANAGIFGPFVIFAAYIVITNYSNSLFNKRLRGRQLLASVSLFAAIGIFLFTLTSNLAFALIGG